MSEKEKQSDDHRFCNTTQMKVQIQKLESELAQAKEELKQVIKIGVEGQREINRKAQSENTKPKGALKILRDAVEFYYKNGNECGIWDNEKNKNDWGCRAREALKKADEILEGK